jgi:hypothetical protein
MSNAITADDVDARFYEASAAISKTSSSIKKNVPIYKIAGGLWKIGRVLGQVNDSFTRFLEFDGVPGLTCQHFEKILTELIGRTDGLLTVCKAKGLNNCTLTGGSLRLISTRLDELKDIWVAVSSSTDADLDDALKAPDVKEYVEWESLWR